MDELSALLASSAGTFFTQLTIMIVIFGTIIVATGRNSTENVKRRIVSGLGLLLLLRLILSLAALGVSAAGLPPAAFGWTERGLTTASWAILAWLWAAPDRSKTADTAAGLLFLLSLALTFLTAGMAAAGSTPGWLSMVWGGFAMLVLLGGLLLLFQKKPENWGYGTTLLGILLAAEIYNLILNDPGSAPGILRIAQVAAFPILLTLPQRIKTSRIAPAPTPIVRSAPERKRVNLPPGMYGKFLTLSTETELIDICRGIAETVSFALVADICLVVSRPTELDEIIIYCGYDQVLEQEIMGAQIAARHLPMVAAAIQKHAPLRLPASSASSDLKFLSSALNLPKSGHLLVAPIRTQADIGVGALILLTPYSSRTWTQDDQNYLMLAAEKVGYLLDQSQVASELRRELAQLRSEIDEISAAQVAPREVSELTSGPSGDVSEALLEQAAYRQNELEAEVAGLKESNRQLLEELSDRQWQQTIEHLQAENIQLQLMVQELEDEAVGAREKADGLRNAQKESQQLIEKLHQENERLQHELEMASRPPVGAQNGRIETGDGDKSHLEKELKAALREVANLRNLHGEAEIRILELQNLASANEDTSRQWETIITLAEEMRQPMSSILGYSDFLLTESVGLLGTLQRKFLERVKTSTNRMSAMVEDLVHIAAAESGRLKLNISEVNLTSIIDAAIAASSVQMREKTITLLVNLPDDLPTIEGDREALRLTLIHLLHNAAAVTPAQGEISIEIILEEDAGEDDYMEIFVSDGGGGIPPEHLSQVFERRLQSKDELIPGLGVSNSGLSIAKTLVEAHGGRIWVENRFKGGATFCILLPLKQDVSASLFGDRGF